MGPFPGSQHFALFFDALSLSRSLNDPGYCPVDPGGLPGVQLEF